MLQIIYLNDIEKRTRNIKRLCERKGNRDDFLKSIQPICAFLNLC